MARRISHAHVEATIARVDYYREMLGKDSENRDLWLSTVEGETQAFEDIDALTQLAIEDSMSVAYLQARAKRLKERYDKGRGMIIALMGKVGLKTLAKPLATLSITQRTQCVIHERDRIPVKYWIKVIDEDAVAKDLRAGEDVPGAELAPAAPSLTIRKD